MGDSSPGPAPTPDPAWGRGAPCTSTRCGHPRAHTPGDFSAPVPTVWGGSPLYTQETSVGLVVRLPCSAALGGPVRRAEAAVKGGGGRQPHSRLSSGQTVGLGTGSSWLGGAAEHSVRQGWAAPTSSGGGWEEGLSR